MISLKKLFFFAFLMLIFLTGIGCSPTVAPNPTTPTPLPVVVQADAVQPTTPAVESPIEKEAVVDSLYLAIEHLFPVKARATVGGYLPDDCVEISGWEQSLNGNVLFARPIITRLEGATCSNSQIRFEEDIDMDVNGLSASELANGDYFLDANGWTMPLSPAFTSSLLDQDLNNCPVGDEGQILYFNEQAGFCLLFPDTFKMQDNEAPGVAGFYGPALEKHTLQPLQAVLYVNFQDLAYGRSLEDIAKERLAGSGEVLTVTSTSIASEPAILVEGQGERSKFLQIVTTHNDQVFALTVSPYDEAFPQAASDVDLAWNLILNSFTFIRPQADQTSGQANLLTKYEQLLKESISSHDFDMMQALMDETFGFAFWGSEGYAATPEESIGHFQINYLFPDNTIHFEVATPDLSSSLGPRTILSVWDPSKNPVVALFSTGWGPEGQDEAFMIIIQKPDGSYAWEGIILAHGSYGASLDWRTTQLERAHWMPGSFCRTWSDRRMAPLCGPRA